MKNSELRIKTKNEIMDKAIKIYDLMKNPSTPQQARLNHEQKFYDILHQNFISKEDLDKRREELKYLNEKFVDINGKKFTNYKSFEDYYRSLPNVQKFKYFCFTIIQTFEFLAFILIVTILFLLMYFINN